MVPLTVNVTVCDGGAGEVGLSAEKLSVAGERLMLGPVLLPPPPQAAKAETSRIAMHARAAPGIGRMFPPRMPVPRGWLAFIQSYPRSVPLVKSGRSPERAGASDERSPRIAHQDGGM